MTHEEIGGKIDGLVAIGGTQILVQGGFHPKLKIDFYEELVGHIHEKYPQITIHAFSAIELDYIAKISKITIVEVLQRLKAKGLSSIPGTSAAILSDRVRDLIAPKQHDSEVGREVHRQAHNLGTKATSTMMFGAGYTAEELI